MQTFSINTRTRAEADAHIPVLKQCKACISLFKILIASAGKRLLLTRQRFYSKPKRERGREVAFVNGTMPVLPSLYIKITRQIIKWNSDHIKTPEMCSKERPIMDFISKKFMHPLTHALLFSLSVCVRVVTYQPLKCLVMHRLPSQKCFYELLQCFYSAKFSFL